MGKTRDNIYRKAFWELCEKYSLLLNRELFVELGIPKIEILSKLKEYLVRIREERHRRQRRHDDACTFWLFSLETRIIAEIEELETELQEEECDELIKNALMELRDYDLS